MVYAMMNTSCNIRMEGVAAALAAALLMACAVNVALLLSAWL